MSNKRKSTKRGRNSRVSGLDLGSIDWAAMAQQAGGLALGGIATDVANKVIIGNIAEKVGNPASAEKVSNALTGVGGLLLTEAMQGNPLAEAAGMGMAAVSLKNLAVSFIPMEARDKLGIGSIGSMSVLDLPLEEETIGYLDQGSPNVGMMEHSPNVMGATNM